MAKKLPNEISKNGYLYKLVQRTEGKAIYKQTYNNTLVGYEVFKIRIQCARYSQILGRSIPECERFPCNEDFGRTAWSFRDIESALIRYFNI